MPKTIHAIYNSIIGVLVVALGLSLSPMPAEASEEEALPRSFVAPFLASGPGTRVASVRLGEGLFQELSKHTDLIVLISADEPPATGPNDFIGWIENQKVSWILLGSVSGSEDNLQVSVQLFHGKFSERIWMSDLVTNIYDLECIYEEIAGDVLSLTSRRATQ